MDNLILPITGIVFFILILGVVVCVARQCSGQGNAGRDREDAASPDGGSRQRR